nr:hypothetical protein [Sedimentibacter sp.]
MYVINVKIVLLTILIKGNKMPVNFFCRLFNEVKTNEREIPCFFGRTAKVFEAMIDGQGIHACVLR